MEQPELSLYVECHEFVCTIDTRGLERLVLPYEVRSVKSDGVVPVVEVGGRNYASFNLGRLLGMPPTHGSSILVRTVFGGAELPLCFETGSCLVVRPAEPTIKLASGLFSARRRAIVSAFPLPIAMRIGRRSPVGLTLEVDELVSAAERDSAAGVLRAMPSQVASTA
jgi:hypothetical protein